MDKHSILIVDDEPRLIKSLSLLLKSDFHVVTASNGQEGYEEFKSNPGLSMILLDLDMPVMNGVEMLERVRDKDRNLKVLIMTGRSTHEWARKCANLNVQGYIDKPFDIDELTGNIKKILNIKECEILRGLLGNEYDVKIASSNSIVKRAIEYVNSTDPGEYNIKQMALDLEVSQEHLSRVFHKETGIQLKEYVGRVKIERSKAMIRENPGATIKELAGLIGISNVGYFSRLFKKYAGVTPAEYRKKRLN